MKALATFLVAAALAAGLSACDSDETTTPAPLGCTTNEACDDGLACTLDRCDPLTNLCVHATKGCEDGDACTLDSCDSGSGECVHAAKTCNDANLCTTDSCDPAAGCVFTPTRCEGDGNPCTIAACVPATGACEDAPKDCNDNNVCTADSCTAATGDCAHAPVTDGATCVIGPDFTAASECRAGLCVPVEQILPGAFRITAIALVSPEVTFDLGNGPEPVNAAISTYLTERVAQFEGGGMVAIFTPLHFGETGANLTFGEGECPDGPDGKTWCGLLPGGQKASFEYVEEKATGSCSTDPSVPAPCFKTPDVPFYLSDLLPNWFPNPTDPVMGMAVGGLPGSPISGIPNGWVLGFVPKSVVDPLSVDLAGRTVTGAELLKDVPTTTRNDVAGYEVRVSFIAVRTAMKPAD